MLSIPSILAAGSLFTLISGAPVPSLPSLGSVTDVTFSPSLRERDAFVYVTYGGDGEVSNGWPSLSDWISSFDTMFDNNKQIMENGCSQFGVPNNSDDEIQDIHDAILSVASSTSIDPRFILAIMLQESNGCARAPTTNYGVRNPGLMQDHNGAGTCNDNNVVSNPCPMSEITQMIQDGAAGTSSGDGLKQCLAKSGATDVSMYYKAARIYNSGSIDPSGNLGAGIATHCYASDIANRLTGWDAGVSGCNSGTVGSLTTTPGVSSTTQDNSANSPAALSQASASTAPPSAPAPSLIAPPSTPSAANPTTAASTAPTTGIVAAAVEPAQPAAPAVTTVPVASPAPIVDAVPTPVIVTITSTAIPVPAATSPAPEAGTFLETSSSSGSSSSSTSSSSDPIYPYAVSNCQQYYSVLPGDYCILVEQKFGITPAQLQAWNAGLDDACTNLWLGYQYCIQA